MDAVNISIKIVRKEGGYSLDANLPLLTKEKDGHFYVQCPVLKTIGYSNISAEEAQIDHDKDLDVFFKVHLARQTINSALTNLGWERVEEDSFTTLSDILPYIDHAKMVKTSYASEVAA